MRIVFNRKPPRWKFTFAYLPHHCNDIDAWVWLEHVWKLRCYSESEPMAGAIFNSFSWNPPSG